MKNYKNTTMKTNICCIHNKKKWNKVLFHEQQTKVPMGERYIALPFK